MRKSLRVTSLLAATVALVAACAPSTSRSPASSGQSTRPRTDAARDYGRLPLAFEANAGQHDPAVRFSARGGGLRMFLTPTETVLALQAAPSRATRGDLRPPAGAPTKSASVRLRAIGANADPDVVGESQLEGKANYLIGNDPAAWHTDVPTFARATVRDLYPGIDATYYGNGSSLEYDWVVHPGADASHIALSITGARGLQIDRHGDLVLDTAAGRVTQHRPRAFQGAGTDRQRVDARYVLEGTTLRLRLGRYDHTRVLVIDPTLVYSTYLGGNGNDRGLGIAVDGAGNAYVTGSTTSTNFPTASPRQAASGGGTDAFVAKLNPSGSALAYSTYLGGTGLDAAQRIAVDGSGNAYVTGVTTSTNFPTASPIQAAFAGVIDVFVVKLNPSGSALTYSTYLGGSGQENPSGGAIAVDGAGAAYVTGDTTSTNFPTANAFQAATGGSVDAFVTKLNPAGSALVYSTYLGGSSLDFGRGIAVDGAGAAYVAGQTGSTNFPTANALQAAMGVGPDAFVTKLTPAGSAIAYSTYLGAGSGDNARGIALDATGAAYVAGQTESTNFPTANAFQATFGGGQNDAFVAKINAAGSALTYSTYLGGGGADGGHDIAVDGAGAAHVAGSVTSSNFPTASPIQAAFAGVGDAFVTKLSPAGSGLVYSTYLGGSGSDAANGIAVDAGAAYIAGDTLSTNFPTANPRQATHASDSAANDAFVAKISAAAPPTPPTTTCTRTVSGSAPAVTVNAGETVCITNATVNGPLTVNPGGGVRVFGSRISGATVASTPTQFVMCGSSTTGSVSVSNATGLVQIGDWANEDGFGCSANRVGIDVVLSGNTRSSEVSNTTISGNLSVTNVTGQGPFPDDTAPELEGNRISGNLSCSGNSPAPTNDGTPNTVSGARSGQCAAL